MDFYINEDGNIESVSEFMTESLINEISSDDKNNYPKKNTLLNMFGTKQKEERYRNNDNFYRDVYE